MAEQNQLYQHFNPSERQFIDKCLDWVNQVENYYAPVLTDFLDPRQVEIARSVFGQSDLTYYVSSDIYPLEYARIILAPSYYELAWEDFEMTLVDIVYQAKFAQLTHAQILGTILNRLGIKRQLLGDILVAEGKAQVIIANPLVEHLIENTEKIARTGVKLKKVSFDNLLVSDEVKKSRQILVSSYRLDKIVASVTKLSRQEAQTLLQTGRVKVNYQEVIKLDYQLNLGDLLSIRGYGRARLLEDLGLTKTGKHKLIIEEILKRKEKY